MKTGTVGIVGLGLIGGSFAKAYHVAGWKVLASNRTERVLEFAKIGGDVDDTLTNDNIGTCDLVLLTIFPEASIQALKGFAPYIGKKPLVMDCCGTKRVVCEACFPIAEEYGFTYLGGMSEKIAVPRLKQPRVKIPAGSVGMGHDGAGGAGALLLLAARLTAPQGEADDQQDPPGGGDRGEQGKCEHGASTSRRSRGGYEVYFSSALLSAG